MAIAFVNSKLQERTEVTSIELEKPTSHASGNLIVGYCYQEKSTKPISLSSTGMTFAELSTGQKAFSTSWRVAVIYGIDDGSSNKVKMTWEGNEKTGAVLGLECWSGVDTATPIDVVAASWDEVAALKEITVSAVATATANAMQIIAETNGSGALLSEVPAGFTRRINYSPTTLSRLRESTGTTGTTTLKVATNQNMVAINFALRPASEATPHFMSLLGVGQ